MNDSSAKRNRGVLLITGVSPKLVPVLQQLELWLKRNNTPMQIVELTERSRIRFIMKSVVTITGNRNRTVIFANPQALVVLRIMQCLPLRIHRIIYWAFESSTSAPLFSPVWAGIVAERIIRHKAVDLIIPLEERRAALSADYRSVRVFENVAETGREYIARNILESGAIHLVLYGQLDATYTYVQEFIDLASAHPQLYTLTLIGDLHISKGRDITASNITCKRRMAHSDLIEYLKGDFHYSVVGYKPITFNYRFCAPNKLLESYSVSLPVLANTENPSLARLVVDCGVMRDFSSINAEELHAALRENYLFRQKAAHFSYSTQYNFDAKAESTFPEFAR